MVDFLRANPFVTMDQYMYELSIPMITLMSIDATRVETSSNHERSSEKAITVDNAEDLFKQLQTFKNGK